MGSITPDQLKKRMFDLAVRTLTFVRSLPRGMIEFRLGGQLIDSASSTPAQYRAACRAQSTKDFIAKIKKLEEEADESFCEITAIAVASVKTSRARLKRERAASRATRQRERTGPREA